MRLNELSEETDKLNREQWKRHLKLRKRQRATKESLTRVEDLRRIAQRKVDEDQAMETLAKESHERKSLEEPSGMTPVDAEDREVESGVGERTGK